MLLPDRETEAFREQASAVIRQKDPSMTCLVPGIREILLPLHGGKKQARSQNKTSAPTRNCVGGAAILFLEPSTVLITSPLDS